MNRIVIAMALLLFCGIASAAETFRYIRITSITAYHNGSGLYEAEYTTSAEVNLRLAGTPLSRSGWTATASSEETSAATHVAANVLDGDADTIWHTSYSSGTLPQPYTLTIDAGSGVTFDTVVWKNRAGDQSGGLGQYEIHGSNDGSSWTLIGSGTAQTGPPTGGADLVLPVSGGGCPVCIMMQMR